MIRFRWQKGFTILEVSLVLALTSLITIGVMIGTSTTIARQRYHDSVNDIVDFLRSTYSEVINVQNNSSSTSASPIYCSISITEPISSADPGRTNCAIYGKLVTFGELDADNTTITHDIRSYDIVGKLYISSVGETTSGDDKDLLKLVGADVVTITKDKDKDQYQLAPAGSFTNHLIKWDARLETRDGTQLRGALAIVRSPSSGSIHTYYVDYSERGSSKLPIDILTAIESTESFTSSDIINTSSNSYYKTILNDMNNSNDYTFCVNSDDIAGAGQRRGIRILADGHNGTAVELLNTDYANEEDSPCPSI